MKKIKENWPFSVKITDWNIVAEIAHDPMVEQDDGINSVTPLRDSTS